MMIGFIGLITKIERRAPVLRGRKAPDGTITLERGPEQIHIIFSNHLSIKLDPSIVETIGWQEGDEIEFTAKKQEPHP